MESGPMSSFPQKLNHFENQLRFIEKDSARISVTFWWLLGELAIVKLSILGVWIPG